MFSLLLDKCKFLWAALRAQPWLLGLFIFCVVGASVSVHGLVVQAPMLDEVPIWLKPFKFSLSIGIMALTLAAYATCIPASRWVTVLIAVCSITLGIELVLISIQAARGVHSHFNVSSVLNATIFSIMGISIGTFWGCLMIFWFWLWRSSIVDAALKVAMLWGLVVGILAMGNGWNMVGVTKEQRQAIRERKWDFKAGSHAIGNEVPSKRIPVLGWSRTAGDLRVAHFLGIHALQLLPLLALAFAAAGIQPRKNIFLMHLAGLLLLAGVIGTWLQARAGIPLIGL